MQLDYERALRLKGQMIRFKNSEGEWTIGRVVRVKKEGLEIEELGASSRNDGYGFGFFRPGPFFGPPAFFPFVGFGFAPLFFW